MNARRASLLLALASLCACAKAADPAPASPANQAQPYGATNNGWGQPTAAQPRHEAFAQPPPPPATAPQPTAMPMPAGAGFGTITQREIDIMSAVIEVQRLLTELQGGLSVCDAACRSLASIERSVKVICSLVKDDERPRCDEARARLREARARVRDACGQCSNGARTDPDAPDP